MCFKHVLAHADQADSSTLDQPEASVQRLVQLQSFARGMAPTTAGLDIKPFLVPHLPAQLLVLVITSMRLQGNSGVATVDEARNLSTEDLKLAVAGMQLAAVEELCLHCNSNNVQQVAELVEALPSPTVLMEVPSSPSVQSTAGFKIEFKLSSSTTYTAAVCASVLEMAGLQQGGDSQTEACQETADYLPCLSPPHLQNLLLWCGLDQAHPLLPSGPQLPKQLPADLRLSLLQTGLEVLLRQAEAGVEFEQDGRLQLEAHRLQALCDVQQSCELTPEQWGMVEQALAAITTADGGRGPAAVLACIADLVASGLVMSNVLSAAESLQGLSAVVDEEEQSQPQAAAAVSAVVQRQVTEALVALSSTSGKLADSMPASESATRRDRGQAESATTNNLGQSEAATTNNSQQLEQHMHGVGRQAGGGSPASPAQALTVILGILQSLRSIPTSAKGHALVSELRQHVWTALQHDLFSRQDPSQPSSLAPQRLQLLEAVLALSTTQADQPEGESTSLVASPGRLETAARLPVIQWQDWSPDEEDSSSLALGQQMLLVSRSRAVVSALWPKAALTGQDLANHSAAQRLFLRLLGRAGEGEQLHGLWGLLEHVWQSGDAIPSDQVWVQDNRC